jgi:phosphatidylinositol alpha-1,6-mannosyltransferase
MQKYCYELTTTLGIMAEAKIVAWGGSQAFLPWFCFQAFFQSVFWLLSRPIDIIHIGDALLSPLGWIFKKIFNKPVVATLHGLDLTFYFRPYQWIVPRFLRRLDKLICISQHTQQEAVARGVSEEKTVVIPNGIIVRNGEYNGAENAGQRLIENLIGRNLADKKILLTVGRLVKRKGVDYFISQILTKILSHRDDVVYLVIGEGKHRATIEKAISNLGLKDKVFLLGRVGDSVLQACYKIAHIFVMPNIPVDGDVEGFGLVALEASLASLPVVASKVEGVCEAIVHEENGILIDHRNRDAFADAVLSFLNDESKRRNFGACSRDFTVQRYSWERIGKEYLKIFEDCL